MPPDSHSVSVIIPAFNEARQIGASVDQLAAWLSTLDWTWEIRVVDDGSLDGTFDVVAARSQQEPRITVQREPHRGKGAAVRAGMLATSAALRLMCDADLSMPPGEWPRLVAEADAGADVVVGSREGPGARRLGEPWYRHATGRAFNWVIRAAAVPGIADTQCGFKLFTARAATAIFSRTTLDGWAFDVEVLAIARALGLRVVVVPIEWHHRARSQVSVWRDAWPMLCDVLRVRRRWGRAR